ncbi:hypothetical protein [Marinomonas sp. MED121]|uniref:hypothetical protein n=1 Tax=Marinomonas sp. MED121 TaxID=314277 RepID=UPI0002F5FFA8|nr:hypothetical protein [Marinomonas sp. MED121]
MIGLSSRLKVGFFSIILISIAFSSVLKANEENLLAQGLSQNVSNYSSINYLKTGKSKRKLTYSLLPSKEPALVLVEQENQLVFQAGLKALLPLFDVKLKALNYNALKASFVDEKDAEDELDFRQELSSLNDKLILLEAKGKASQDPQKLKAIHSDLADLRQEKNKIENAISAIERRQQRLSSLAVLNFAEVINKRPKNPFFLMDNNYLYFVDPQQSRVSYQDAISGQNISAIATNYYLETGINVSSPERLEAFDTSILTLVSYQDTLLKIEYEDNLVSLTRLEDSHLTRFEKMLSATVLQPKKLEFKGESLITQYLWANQNERKTLEFAYKETGKRKNLIQVKASAQSSVFDPKQSSSALEKHIGVLAVAKGKRLVELKKVQTINGKKDIGWDQDIRNGIIKLGDETIFVSKEDYYGYEGLWYLASWMSLNGINQKKVFLINGTEPISLTATLTTAGEVVISKAGNTLYQFKLDEGGFVTQLYFAPSKQTLILINKDTETTKSNKAKVKNHMRTNKIVLL